MEGVGEQAGESLAAGLQVAWPALAAWTVDGPAHEAGSGPAGWWAFSGDPTGENFITCMAQPDDDAARFLGERVGWLRERGVPGDIFLPAVTPGWEAVARRIGLRFRRSPTYFRAEAGAIPAPGAGAPPVRVAEDLATWTRGTELVAEVFGENRGLRATLFGEGVFANPAITMYQVEREGAVASSIVTHRLGGEGYVIEMATGERFQRQGIGRDLLRSALAAERAAGATRFHLLSSPVGEGLYRGSGFQPLGSLGWWRFEPA